MGQILFVTTPHNSGSGDPLATAFEAQQSMNTELYDTVVFEVPGKGLSEANFTNTDKAKLDSIDTPIAPQVQSDYGQTNALAIDFIKNKKTNLSEFVNDGDGSNPFVADVDVAGSYVRVDGAWQLLGSAPVTDSIIDYPLLLVATQNFTIPIGKVAKKVYVNNAIYFPSTINNTTKNNTFTQSGTTVTTKLMLAIGNYVVIEF
jgi:hypothetical protein